MAQDNDTIDAFFCTSKILPGSGLVKPNKKSRGRNPRPVDTDTGFFDWLAPYYERLQPVLNPTRFQTQSVLLDILNAIEPEPQTILDLGCGTGILTLQVLELLPDSHVYAIDGSLPMLEAARENLADFSDQVTLAKADFRDSWEEIIPEPVDVIIHYIALHHLPHDALREVFTRLVKILKPGGWLIHGDIIAERLPQPVQRISQKIHEFQRESAIMDMSNGEELLEKFNEIRKANEDNGGLTDLPALPEQQVAWLIEAGFEFATRVFQDWQTSLFIARKPE